MQASEFTVGAIVRDGDGHLFIVVPDAREACGLALACDDWACYSVPLSAVPAGRVLSASEADALPERDRWRLLRELAIAGARPVPRRRLVHAAVRNVLFNELKLDREAAFAILEERVGKFLVPTNVGMRNRIEHARRKVEEGVIIAFNREMGVIERNATFTINQARERVQKAAAAVGEEVRRSLAEFEAKARKVTSEAYEDLIKGEALRLVTEFFADNVEVKLKAWPPGKKEGET